MRYYGGIMDIGEQSIDHLNKHIDEGFSEIMANYVVDYVQWLEEDGDVYIAYAPMLNTNVIALFPPFIPTGANNT